MEWIKVEHSMPDKPEVALMAEALEIDHDAVVGKLLRFWIWADQQAENGNAIGVTKALLDRVTLCAGFADALLIAGWLKPSNQGFCIPNFDRHNGKSSKKRALARQRMKRFRDAKRVTKVLPEVEVEVEVEKNTSTELHRRGTDSSCSSYLTPPVSDLDRLVLLFEQQAARAPYTAGQSHLIQQIRADAQELLDRLGSYEAAAELLSQVIAKHQRAHDSLSTFRAAVMACKVELNGRRKAGDVTQHKATDPKDNEPSSLEEVYRLRAETMRYIQKGDPRPWEEIAKGLDPDQLKYATTWPGREA